jgi:hypothetical protein
VIEKEYKKLSKDLDFPPEFRSETEVMAIDFDGVIHNDYKGFADGSLYGPVIAGTREALSLISKTHQIVIFTAKARSDRPKFEGKTGEELVWDWLYKNDLEHFVHEVTAIKPRAHAYIDDKAIHFTDWRSTMDALKEKFGIQ